MLRKQGSVRSAGRVVLEVGFKERGMRSMDVVNNQAGLYAVALSLSTVCAAQARVCKKCWKGGVGGGV